MHPSCQQILSFKACTMLLSSVVPCVNQVHTCHFVKIQEGYSCAHTSQILSIEILDCTASSAQVLLQFAGREVQMLSSIRHRAHTRYEGLSAHPYRCLSSACIHTTSRRFRKGINSSNEKRIFLFLQIEALDFLISRASDTL